MQDCYWYEDGSKMKAICVKCHQSQPKGWLWKGSQLGYGDYELYCASCNTQINNEENGNSETTL